MATSSCRRTATHGCLQATCRRREILWCGDRTCNAHPHPKSLAESRCVLTSATAESNVATDAMVSERVDHNTERSKSLNSPTSAKPDAPAMGNTLTTAGLATRFYFGGPSEVLRSRAERAFARWSAVSETLQCWQGFARKAPTPATQTDLRCCGRDEKHKRAHAHTLTRTVATNFCGSRAMARACQKKQAHPRPQQYDSHTPTELFCVAATTISGGWGSLAR